MKEKKVQKSEKKRGFVLLFAVLVSSIVLSVGLSVFSITLKELILSSAGRESQFAFFAADTGWECALFWTVYHPHFAVSPFAAAPEGDEPTEARCGGHDILPQLTPGSGEAQTFTLDEPCTTVSVTSSESGTSVAARGYNTCDTSDPRRVERAIQSNF